MKNILSLVGAGLVGGLIVAGVLTFTRSNTNVSPRGVARLANDYAPAGAADLSAAAAVASPTVVYIEASESKENYRQRQRESENDPFSFFFGFQQPMKKGTGSGVIISEDGYIVTNNHVVDFADEVKVNLTDGRSFSARVVGTDPRTDLAVLKINTSGLPAIQKGNSDNLRIGEWVLAIGYPYDIGTTVTAGIVSAKDKKLRDDNPNVIEHFIQTDAVVNPGNSGGALVDAQGRLVGINTAIVTRTGGYQGYSFAIPVNLMMEVTDQIIKTGGVKRQTANASKPRLGIEMVPDQYFEEVAREKNLSISEGVIVDNVVDGGAAQLAGIVPSDVIVKINGRAIRSISEVKTIVATANPGDVLKITVFRNGRTRDIAVSLRG